MGHQYAGADSFPSDFTIPDDLDDDKAATFNVALEALGDRTIHLNALAVALKVSTDRHEALNQLLPSVNFPNQFSVPAVMAGAAFCPKKRVWYVTAGSGKLYTSYDHGQTFGTNQIGAVSAGTEAVEYIDVDGAGNAVAACDSNHVFTFNGATWAKVTLTGSLVDTDSCSIVYDPIHALWCWTGINVANPNTCCRTSSDRATWTDRTAALNRSADAYNTSRLGVDKATGRICLMSNAGGVHRVTTSDDGGVTWTARSTLTPLQNDYTTSNIWHNATSGKWLYVTGKPSTCEVWQSAAAVTWTRVATLTASNILRAVSDDTVWAALNNLGDILYSLDDGATWLFSGFRVASAAPKGVFAGNGGFLCVSTDSSAPSIRVRVAGAVAT